jgi:hypothetical protein
VRTAPNEVSFSSPNAARDIFAVGKGFHKTMFYSVFPPKVVTSCFPKSYQTTDPASTPRISSPKFENGSTHR